MSKTFAMPSKGSAQKEAAELMRILSEPAQPGAHFETLIRNVARLVGFKYSRAYSLWYGNARRVDAEEMDTLRHFVQARNKSSTINDLHGNPANDLRQLFVDTVSRLETVEREILDLRSRLHRREDARSGE